MDQNKPTLAIYGIQDRENFPHPFYVHDHNLAIMHNGKILHFLQQERISRRKRDNTFHINTKDYLKEKKLLGTEFDLVFVDNVVGRTFITKDGDARFEAPLTQSLSTEPEKGKCWWFGKENTAYAVNHELAHIFTCLPFFGSFKENSLLVHFDGGASLSNFSAAMYKNGIIEWLEYNWDFKPYSSIFNANALVFAILGAKMKDQNSVPGKFMGFAGFGSYNKEIEEWLVKNNLFQETWGKTSVFFREANKKFGIQLKSFSQKNTFVQDVAATLHHIFVEKIVLKLTLLAEKTGAQHLYYTGGSALNIVANSKIINNNIFENVFIPPCTDDSGLALGAAAFAEWKKFGKVEPVASYLNNWNIENYAVEYSEKTIKEAANYILAKKTIGVCNGYGEAGPRALGNRSILCLANSKKLANEVSQLKKGREWYRPLAPIALEKNTRYFTGLKKIHPLSKYMLLDFNVLPGKRKELAGATHADGTARFQTIFNKTDNPFIFDLLQYLDKNHKVKALINTSFNTKGEPIVHTTSDAWNAAVNMKLDGLIVNGKFKKMND